MSSLHYNGSCCKNALRKYHFIERNCEIKPYPLCLDNISKYFKIGSMKKPGLIRCVYVLSVDYDIIDTNDISDVHRYLMKITNHKLN